jgi:hypothetical protein
MEKLSCCLHKAKVHFGNLCFTVFILHYRSIVTFFPLSLAYFYSAVINSFKKLKKLQLDSEGQARWGNYRLVLRYYYQRPRSTPSVLFWQSTSVRSSSWNTGNRKLFSLISRVKHMMIGCPVTMRDLTHRLPSPPILYKSIHWTRLKEVLGSRVVGHGEEGEEDRGDSWCGCRCNERLIIKTLKLRDLNSSHTLGDVGDGDT